MTERFAQLFSKLRTSKNGALVAFVNLCDPSPEKSREILNTLTEAGTDAFELGIPFSDPCADDPAVCIGTKRAIENGSDTQKCLEVVRSYRAEHPDVPISLTLYLNQAFAPGLENFFADCSKAGVDAVRIVDIPCSMRAEDSEWDKAARRFGISLVGAVAPNTSDENIRLVAGQRSEYVGLMTAGTLTDAADSARSGVQHAVKLLKQTNESNAALVLNCNDADTAVSAMRCGAAGVVVSAAYARIINENISDEPRLKAQLTDFTKRMKAALGNTLRA